MDPTTVVIILAANLICSGGLFHLIGRRMPQSRGLAHWSAGSILFGSTYLARLALGPAAGGVATMLMDTAMVCAALAFLVGLRQWVHDAPLRWSRLATAGLVYAAAQLLATQAGGVVGRFTLLNLTLAAVYAAIALGSAIGARQSARTLRTPLLTLAVLMGGLALLTALRGLHIATNGIDSMYRGLAAQIYYAYASLAVVLLGMNLLWMVFLRLNGQLLELATRDALTRVLNRNGLDDVLVRHFSARGAPPIALISVDVDHFKRVNDEFGHATGDVVLRNVAEALARRVRGNDFVARVGGEEFLVGCVGGDKAMAVALGERLRTEVAALRIARPNGRADLTCTVSIGVSTVFDSLAERDRATQEADLALYAAKSAGRNRVEVFEPALA
ncbi:MAG: GGDEF domain-containing protein [Burkholderiaceae bacterium]